jgi:hypothetical protein
MVDGEEAFSFDKGARVVTDPDGKILKVIGIEPEEKQVELRYGGAVQALTVAADGVYPL